MAILSFNRQELKKWNEQTPLHNLSLIFQLMTKAENLQMFTLVKASKRFMITKVMQRRDGGLREEKSRFAET